MVARTERSGGKEPLIRPQWKQFFNLLQWFICHSFLVSSTSWFKIANNNSGQCNIIGISCSGSESFRLIAARACSIGSLVVDEKPASSTTSVAVSFATVAWAQSEGFHRNGCNVKPSTSSSGMRAASFSVISVRPAIPPCCSAPTVTVPSGVRVGQVSSIAFRGPYDSGVLR